MPRTSNQKLKSHAITQVLQDYSDEEHPLSATELIGHLLRYGITAERRTIYDDIEQLQRFGVPIEQVKGHTAGYYIAERPFELAELKVLVDAVSSSRHLSTKRSERLIRRISSLGSVHQAKQLNRQVSCYRLPKTPNETVIYIVDALNTALDQQKQISFRYFDYDAKLQRVYRKEGQSYVRSPIGLTWSDDCHYLIAYSSKYAGFAHFRIDRMSDVVVLENRAERPPQGKSNLAEYGGTIFGMYGGEAIQVTLSFDPSLINNILDRFGYKVRMQREANGWVTVNARIVPSPTFYAWLVQFGNRARIIKPKVCQEGLQSLVSEVSGIYKAQTQVQC